MENINIEKLSNEELLALKEEILNLEKRRKEEELQKQQQIEEQRKEAKKNELEMVTQKNKFTKNSSDIIKELINMYNNISTIKLDNLEEKEKLILTLQKNYIESLLIEICNNYINEFINKICLHYCYDEKFDFFDTIQKHSFDEIMAIIYDYIIFTTKKASNGTIINICTKKLATLNGMDSDLILKISNFNARDIRVDAFDTEKDLVYVLNNIEAYISYYGSPYIDDEGNIHSHYSGKNFLYEVYKKPVLEGSNIPLSNISSDDFRTVHEYLRKIFKLNISTTDKEESIINIINHIVPQCFSRKEKQYKDYDRSAHLQEKFEDIKDNLEKLLANITNADWDDFDIIHESICYLTDYSDTYIDSIDPEKYAYYTATSLPFFLSKKQEEDYISTFSIDRSLITPYGKVANNNTRSNKGFTATWIITLITSIVTTIIISSIIIR